MTKYVVLVGCNYPVDGMQVRREPGVIVSELPEAVEAALLEMGAIKDEAEFEPRDAAPAAAEKPAQPAIRLNKNKPRVEREGQE